MTGIDRLFVSTATLRLDAKGRISIPAAFRDVLNRQSPGGLLCSTAFSPLAIEAGGQGLLTEIEETIAAQPGDQPDRDAYAAFVFSQCETLRIDREGRIVLSETLKAHAAIRDSATFAGLGHKFRIWEPERFRAQMSDARAQFGQWARADARAVASFPGLRE